MEWYEELVNRSKSIIIKGYKLAMSTEAGGEFYVKAAPEVESICENCRLDPPPECREYEHIPDEEMVLLLGAPTKEVPEKIIFIFYDFNSYLISKSMPGEANPQQAMVRVPFPSSFRSQATTNRTRFRFLLANQSAQDTRES